MSRTEAIIENPDPTRSEIHPLVTSRSQRAPWVWAVIACSLLATSGVVRGVQERRHVDEGNYQESCPFDLKTIPKVLGGWRLLPDGEKSLDNDTMRITGGTDHLLRIYVDDLTGQSLGVLLLFGPAEPVLPHTPDVCYPANGFTSAEDTSDRLVKGDGFAPAQFRSAVFQKSGGRMVYREEVYHSFRLAGVWSPDIGVNQKFPRRNPGIFKIQIQRRVADRERRDRDDPIEHFLALFLPEIEKQIALAKEKAEKTTSPISSTTSEKASVSSR